MNPTLRAECVRLLPALEAAKVPATEEEIIMAVGQAMPAWGVPLRVAAENGVTFASYADALEGLPLWAIEEGIVRWNRGEGHKDLAMGGFPPRPAQLSILANEARRELLMAAYRAKLAVEYIEEKAPPPVDPAQQAQVGADFRELAASLRGRQMPEATRPKHSPQEAAALIRAAADARKFGAPVSRKHFEDSGDVV